MTPPPQDLAARVLRRAVQRALGCLSDVQECIVLADLREGGTEDTEALALMLGLGADVIERERRRARRAVLKEVPPTVPASSWADLTGSLQGRAHAAVGSHSGPARSGPVLRGAFAALTLFAAALAGPQSGARPTPFTSTSVMQSDIPGLGGRSVLTPRTAGLRGTLPLPTGPVTGSGKRSPGES